MCHTRIVACILFGVLSYGAAAQKFSLGLKAGVLGAYTNFAEQKDSLKTGIKPGFSVGGLIYFPLKKNYSFVGEAGYSMQGRYWTYKPNGSKWSSTYSFADVSMAMRKHFHLKLFKNVPSTWFVNIGPNLNYWISARGKFEPHQQGVGTPGLVQNLKGVFDQTPTIAYNTLYINRENRWLWGVNIGIGFTTTTMKYQKIVTELRMTWGQTYLGQKNSETLNNLGAIDNMNLKCNLKVLNLSVAYIFERDIQRGRMGKSTKKVK